MAGKSPDCSKEMKTWISCAIGDMKCPDLFFISLQEIVNLNDAGKLVLEHDQHHPWIRLIHKELNVIGQYTLVSSRHLVGMLAVMFIKSPLRESISEIESATLGQGFLGIGGNKGAVALRFKFFQSKFCFLCVHLAPHKENLNLRDQQLSTIVDKLQFDISRYRPLSRQKLCDISTHPFTFLAGDLNYRLDLNDVKATINVIDSGDFRSLLKYDQLSRTLKEDRILPGFVEGVINFPPTYKFQPLSNFYEQRENKTLRVPGWCDRVLWKENQGITQCNYFSADITFSDHKPVHSSFVIDILEPDQEKVNALKISTELRYDELVQKNPICAEELNILRLSSYDGPMYVEKVYMMYARQSIDFMSTQEVRNLVWDLLSLSNLPKFLPSKILIGFIAEMSSENVNYASSAHNSNLSWLDFKDFLENCYANEGLQTICRIYQHLLERENLSFENAVLLTGIQGDLDHFKMSFIEIFGNVNGFFVCLSAETDTYTAVVFFKAKDSAAAAIDISQFGCTIAGLKISLKRYNGERFPCRIQSESDIILSFTAAIAKAREYGKSIIKDFRKFWSKD